MQVFSFIADSAAEALEQIHARLGPEAVVLNVRPAASRGMARLWPGWRRIEVLAGVPDKTSASQPGALAPLDGSRAGFPRGLSEYSVFNDFTPGQQHWRAIQWLEAMGLQPQSADQLQTYLNASHGDHHLPELESEWTAVCGALMQFWQVPPPLDATGAPPLHVFIGPAGSGKSTVLCKWLTLGVLTEEHSGHVWRLDGNTANTSEFLAIHCEMLGVPVERFWSQRGAEGGPDVRGSSRGGQQRQRRPSAPCGINWPGCRPRTCIWSSTPPARCPCCRPNGRRSRRWSRKI